MKVFWKHDTYPFCLCGTVSTDGYKWDGHVRVKEYGGRYLKKEAALATLPDAEGEEINASLDGLRREYEAKKAALLEEYVGKAKAVAAFL